MIVELDISVNGETRTNPNAACTTDNPVFAGTEIRNLDLGALTTNPDQIQNTIITDAGQCLPVACFIAELDLSLSTFKQTNKRTDTDSNRSVTRVAFLNIEGNTRIEIEDRLTNPAKINQNKSGIAFTR